MKYLGLFLAFLFICTTAQAKHDSNHPLTAEDWKEVMDKVVLLEGKRKVVKGSSRGG